jgi:hypothetical protein
MSLCSLSVPGFFVLDTAKIPGSQHIPLLSRYFHPHYAEPSVPFLVLYLEKVHLIEKNDAKAYYFRQSSFRPKREKRA